MRGFRHWLRKNDPAYWKGLYRETKEAETLRTGNAFAAEQEANGVFHLHNKGPRYYSAAYLEGLIRYAKENGAPPKVMENLQRLKKFM